MDYMDLTVCYPRKVVKLTYLLTYGHMRKSWFGPHYEGENHPPNYGIMTHSKWILIEFFHNSTGDLDVIYHSCFVHYLSNIHLF